MTLDDQNTRWIKRANEVTGITQTVLDLVAAQGDEFLTGVNLAGLQGAIEDSSDAISTDAPSPDSPAGEALAPFFEKLHWFCTMDTTELSGAECRGALEALTEAAVETRLRLSDDQMQTWTVDDVIADFANEFRISLLSTMTANNTLVNKLYAWQQAKAAGSSSGGYLDVAKLQFVSEPSISTVEMSVLEGLITAPATVMTPLNISAGMQELYGGGAPPALFRMAYAQWFTSVFASWDDVYRPRLARAHGSDPEGNPWTKEDIGSTFFNDLRMIRNDLVHKKGICVQSADNTVIDWVTRGEMIAPTPRQMLSLLTLFPEVELRTSPTRSKATTPDTDKLPWEFPREWVNRVRDHVVSIQQSKKKRPAVIMAVIDKWINETSKQPPQQDH